MKPEFSFHKRRIIILLIPLLLSLCSYSQRRNLIFESTFDSPDAITKWYEQNLLHQWSGMISNSVVRAGKSSLNVNLIRALDSSNGPRAELGMPPQTQQESWCGFSNYIPTDFVSDFSPESIAQWQARPDFALGEQWRSPPMALLVKNDHFQLEIRWSSNPVNTTQNANFLSFDLGPVTHNIWNDWVFHVKWSYDNSGILQVWKNDSLVLQRVNQPIGYNDILFPYLKVGVYKWDWNSPLMTNSIQRTLYIDEVRVGNNLATYYDVAPKEAVMQTLPIKVNTLEVVKNDDGTFTASFVSSKVYEPTEFVLFISEDNGKSYYPTYTKTTIRLEEGKTYKLNFRSR